MAIQTKNLAITTDQAGNQATLNYKYDDVSLLITEIDIVNGTTLGAFASGTSTSTGKNYQTTVPAGQNQVITVATNKANQLQLTVTPSGRLDGVEWEFRLV